MDQSHGASRQPSASAVGTTVLAFSGAGAGGDIALFLVLAGLFHEYGLRALWLVLPLGFLDPLIRSLVRPAPEPRHRALIRLCGALSWTAALLTAAAALEFLLAFAGQTPIAIAGIGLVAGSGVAVAVLASEKWLLRVVGLTGLLATAGFCALALTVSRATVGPEIITNAPQLWWRLRPDAGGAGWPALFGLLCVLRVAQALVMGAGRPLASIGEAMTRQASAPRHRVRAGLFGSLLTVPRLVAAAGLAAYLWTAPQLGSDQRMAFAALLDSRPGSIIVLALLAGGGGLMIAAFQAGGRSDRRDRRDRRDWRDWRGCLLLAALALGLALSPLDAIAFLAWFLLQAGAGMAFPLWLMRFPSCADPRSVIAGVAAGILLAAVTPLDDALRLLLLLLAPGGVSLGMGLLLNARARPAAGPAVVADAPWFAAGDAERERGRGRIAAGRMLWFLAAAVLWVSVAASGFYRVLDLADPLRGWLLAAAAAAAILALGWGRWARSD